MLSVIDLVCLVVKFSFLVTCNSHTNVNFEERGLTVRSEECKVTDLGQCISVNFHRPFGLGR